jgi:hypothetical protein
MQLRSFFSYQAPRNLVIGAVSAKTVELEGTSTLSDWVGQLARNQGHRSLAAMLSLLSIQHG